MSVHSPSGMYSSSSESVSDWLLSAITLSILTYTEISRCVNTHPPPPHSSSSAHSMDLSDILVPVLLILMALVMVIGFIVLGRFCEMRFKCSGLCFLRHTIMHHISFYSFPSIGWGIVWKLLLSRFELMRAIFTDADSHKRSPSPASTPNRRRPRTKPHSTRDLLHHTTHPVASSHSLRS